ncbi:MAG TPA: glycosyltransferase [Candidatus Binataceae bacterium]|nr:glycosyltransferase [Candidatus Binataceae bacterium]
MPGPLSVTHVGKFYPPHMGGIETHLEALCGELRKSLDVNVIVANDSRHRHNENLDGIRITRLARFATLSSTPVCPRMPSVMRALQSDLVHLHLPNPAALIAYLMSGRRGPFVLTWHSDVVRQKVLARALAPLHRWFVRNAARCIATSPDYIDSSPILSANRSRCSVIPYGIPLEQFAQRGAAVAELRRRHGPRVILTVGRLIYYKGFEFLLRAMSRVDGKLIIVGDGPLRSKLERDTAAIGIGERVCFAGEIHNRDLAPFYHAADVFVLPSVARSEAFGIVQLEAMACGKPVVNTRLDSGVPFVSLDGVTGITVPPCQPAPLADAITRLLDDAELRARYGAAGIRRVRSEFTLERMARRTLDLYHEILPTTGDMLASSVCGAASAS